ncbi:hypothetical protein [Deinococcus kurensis]|uniref:hypothetical protein n=1 Tax=Deinococcus kurensis TaxID=2662757 RepID=UPI0012D31A68|nr:hypothetical protein [Deinococcus kurensis]
MTLPALYQDLTLTGISHAQATAVMTEAHAHPMLARATAALTLALAKGGSYQTRDAQGVTTPAFWTALTPDQQTVAARGVLQELLEAAATGGRWRMAPVATTPNLPGAPIHALALTEVALHLSAAELGLYDEDRAHALIREQLRG